MSFDFSYMERYTENWRYHEMEEYIFFELGDVDKSQEYFLINNEIYQADHGWYDQVTAPRTYFTSIKDGEFAKIKNCKNIVSLNNRPEIILSYLMGYKKGLYEYFN